MWFSIPILFGENAQQVLKTGQVEVLESFFVVGSWPDRKAVEASSIKS